MDLVTHGLASFAIVRAFFPRAERVVVAGAVLAGCLADVDWISSYFGASSFLTWHFTYVHSVLAALVLFTSICGAPIARVYLRSPQTFVPTDPARDPKSANRSPFTPAFAALTIASLLHIAMDTCQSDGVMLLWPFSQKRYALDWLPPLDPWILSILILAIAVPELLRLVSSEIGAKSKKPRGRTGAFVGLTLVLLYIGARGILHTQAVSLMQSRNFHGEPARRSLAFPESLSLLTWHSIAETESALNLIDVSPLAADTFDADASLRVFKPQGSPSLDAARNTRAAKQFLSVAQIPKASVEKTDVGYVVILRDLRYSAAGETQREIAALIELDPDNKVTAQEIVWARDLRN